MSQILVVNTAAELREKIDPIRRKGQTVGLVPTMGALHDGHLSLARHSVSQCDFTIATIFVNPTQFAPGEDLDKYPRTLESDLSGLREAGVDLVFVPDASEVYPVDCSTSIVPPQVATLLEGEFRPTHFGGVCTVVLKLLNMASCDKAFFGQKDFQQVCVIKQMVRDLNVPVEIVVCPIVRDDDGLALSSRNRYLDEQERKTALCLNQTLDYIRGEIESGETDSHMLMAEMRQRIIDAGVTSVDYAAIANVDNLKVVDEISRPVVVLLAAHVGETRLIDNCVIE